MKKVSLTIFVLLVSVFLTGAVVLAGQHASGESKNPGVGKGPESGMTPGHHKDSYHHGKMSTSMETKTAGEILGKTVVSEDNQNLGTLHDLVIFGQGMVHYGILNLEGQKDKYVAIPFNALEKDGEKLVLQMKYRKVMGAPTFSLEEITDWKDSEIGEKVHSYFGMDKMQDRPGIPGREESVPGTGKVPEPGTRRY